MGGRMRVSVLVFASIVAMSVSPARATQLAQGPIYNPDNGHQYYLLTRGAWVAAEAFAVSMGGHLVSINDAAEQDWVYNTFGEPSGTDRFLWIGLVDQDLDGNLRWT